MVLIFSISAYGAFVVAVGADWFSMGKQKGKRLLALTTGAGIGAGTLAMFGIPAMRFRLSFAVARMAGGEFEGGYFRYLVENIWENCRWLGSGTLPQNEMAMSVRLVLSQRQGKETAEFCRLVFHNVIIPNCDRIFAIRVAEKRNDSWNNGSGWYMGCQYCRDSRNCIERINAADIESLCNVCSEEKQACNILTLF